MTHPSPAKGFTLVETLIATGMLVTAIAGLAQLFALSVRFTRDSGQFGVALVAAQDKLETLRSLRFSYDDGGTPVADGRLAASPSNSIRENAAGYFEWLDHDGRVGGEIGAAYLRRWRITDLAADDPAAIGIDVCVFDAAAPSSDPARAHACLATVRVRQP